MPVLRGIDVKLVTYPAKQVIEEYLHPDGSSLRLETRQGVTSAFAEGLPTAASSLTPACPAVLGRKVDPKSSVYIATQPGSQFVIAYDINRVPEGCRYMNFKIFINGRHIVTCGRDLEERRSGVISRTLWAASDRQEVWAGIEGRQFVFLHDETAKSAAEDGGLIEVQVHRAGARTLCAPALREFRQSRHYGLATPSTGLIDKPEDVEWYKYRLIDPIDSPYAKFFFHYRSLQSLKELSLIPDLSVDESNHGPGKEIPQLPKHAPENETRQLHKQQSGNEAGDASRLRSHDQSYLWIDGASDDRPVGKPSSTGGRQHRTRSTGVPAQHAQSHRRENPFLSTQTSRTPLLAPILERPLPNPPSAPVARTRTASKSPAPSLTPSLERSVDNGDFDDDVEIEETRVVHCGRIRERPVLLQLSSARDSMATFGRPSSGAIAPAARNFHRNLQRRAGGELDYNLGSSSGESATAEFGTALEPRPQLSYAERRAMEQDQQSPSNRHASRAQGRIRAGGMMQGAISHGYRRRRPPFSVTVPTYRGTDTTMRSQVQLSPQRQRFADLHLSSEPYSIPQNPATYSALRDLGNQMLSGATFRRDTQVQSQPNPSPQPLRIAQIMSSPERGDPPPSSPASWSSRSSSLTTTTPGRSSLADQRWSPQDTPSDSRDGVFWEEVVRQPRNSTDYPTRPSLAEQRWSPRDAPPAPRHGVSWEEVVRQSPRTDAIIDQMISQLGRSNRLGRSDSSKENRPPHGYGRDWD